MFKVQENLIYNIKFYRKKLKITQEQLAEMCNVSPNYIGRIEIGYHFPSPELLDKFAEIFKIEPYKLFVDSSNFSELNNSDIKLKKNIMINGMLKDVEEIIKKYINNNDF